MDDITITYDARGLVELDGTIPKISEIDGKRAVLEARDLSADEVGVSPEELDEREQRFTRPRKEMGPTTDYRAETTPETPEEGS